MQFMNNTYIKNTTYDDGTSSKMIKYEELYFATEDTVDDLPHFSFKNHVVPVGDSRSSCLHVRLRSKELPLADYSRFDSLKNMPQCFGHNQTYWSKDDPTTGLNLLVWKEFPKGNSTNCSKGIVKNGVCYEYSVLKSICIIIAPVNMDPTQGWEFKTGCYEGGSSIEYQRAVPGTEYNFEKVPIQVWANKGPFYDFDYEASEFGADLSYFGWVSRMCWILCLISFICFALFFSYKMCYT